MSSNKNKNDNRNNTVAYSEMAIRNNLSIVEYCRTSMATLSGCTAGLLGLTGLYGAVFYIFAVVSLWLMVLCKAGFSNWNKYFLSRRSLLTTGFFGHLFTYILCWTFIYGMLIVITSMATDERNFRSAYYEKVGFKSVEEKRSIEILLKDKHLDVTKLKQFCLRFGVPTAYRNLIWKILLGVIPVHVNCHAYVMEQRKEVFCDLNHALKVMRVVSGDTPKPQVFVAVWLLQSGNLGFQYNLTKEKNLIAIVQTFMSYFDNDVDIYWLSRNFYDAILKFRQDIPKLIKCVYCLLEKEDLQLYNHLANNQMLEKFPFADWFNCCYAGIINSTPLAKIWDKVCGGSSKILVYVAVVMLITLKTRLVKCTKMSNILDLINNIYEDVAEMIVNKSIELWQQHGSDKPK